MPSQVVTKSITAGGVTYSQTVTVSSSQEIVTQETVADSTTDAEINLSLDISELVSLMISSTAAVTIETNDGTTPDDTLSVSANEPYIWTENDPAALALTADVTSIFVTNASGSAATVTVIALQDATP